MIKLSIVLAGLIALTGCVSKMPPQASGDAELASLVVYFMQPDELGRHELHAVHGDSNHFGYSQDPTTGKIDFFVVVESIRTRANMWMASPPGAYTDYRIGVVKDYVSRIRQLIKEADGLTEEDVERVLDQLVPEAAVLPEDMIRVVTVTPEQHLEELVRLPEGADPSEYADTVYPINQAPEVEPELVTSWLSLTPGENTPFLTLNIQFGEFRELLPAPRYYEVVTADTGEAEMRPVEKPGIISRTLQVARENPVPTTIVGVLTLDYMEGGGIDLFGLLGGDADKAGTTINISGTSNSVSVSRDDRSDNSNRSNNPQTAQPFFPPTPAE